MNFYFCETCGKRLTDVDLQEGRGRNKQVKGDAHARIDTVSKTLTGH